MQRPSNLAHAATAASTAIRGRSKRAHLVNLELAAFTMTDYERRLAFSYHPEQCHLDVIRLRLPSILVGPCHQPNDRASLSAG